MPPDPQPPAEVLADVFWSVHDGLPRQAPGSVGTLRLLLALAGPLPERPRIVDVGCGTGAAAIPLAGITGGTVTAVDTHAPFLARLRAAAADAGVADRVTAVEAPMQELPLPDGCADLVWADGSAYLMGVDAALAAWRRLLSPGGRIVLTDCTWTTPDPAPGARAFWDPGHPAMRTTGASVTAFEAAGWTVVATHLLPESDWDAYYGPLAARIEQLRAERPDGGPAFEAALAEVGREIAVRREHGRDYGYTGYVLRR